MRTHGRVLDKFCPRCKLVIQEHIIHECDPSICIHCNGRGERWLGRDKETRKFLGWAKCEPCDGTGKTRFYDDEALAVS